MSDASSAGSRLRLPPALRAVAAAFHNRAIRRVLLAFVGFSLAEWSSWIAILVYAFGQGGAAETGVVALLQLAPSAVVAPIAASLGDRIRRDRALRFAYGAQALSMSGAAAALLLGAPNWLVYLAAIIAATSITLTRPLQAALLPELSRTPAELTAANVATGTVETICILVGPVLAGVALATWGPGAVFAGSGLATLIGALLVTGLRSGSAVTRGHVHPDGEPAAGAGLRGAIADTIAGFGMLAHEERPRAVVWLLGAGTVLWGALDVLLVVLAFDVLEIGEAGVGYLNAAIGAGGLFGALASVALIGRHRLAAPLALGMAMWAIPLAAIGLLPQPLAALVLLAVAGAGRLVLDVAGRTLLQRIAPEQMLARVFGVLEGIDMAALALGAILTPLLVAVAGPTGAFVVGGTALLVFTALSWPRLARVDAAGIARPDELALLRAVPMFEPLAPPALERLAANLIPVQAAGGAPIIRQGERGDRFFIITDGRVEVAVDGRVVRVEGPGESFGEIALLRNVPRTATVTALEAVALVALERRVFLEAITGQPASAALAAATVDERMGPGGGREQEADASA